MFPTMHNEFSKLSSKNERKSDQNETQFPGPLRKSQKPPSETAENFGRNFDPILSQSANYQPGFGTRGKIRNWLPLRKKSGNNPKKFGPF